MKISEFTPAQAAKFKDYLIADITSLEKAGMAEVSAAAIIKRIKPILERAVCLEEFSRPSIIFDLNIRRSQSYYQRLCLSACS